MSDIITVLPGKGELSLSTILPNVWQGEEDCAIGPFSCKNTAEYFSGHVVDFSHYETYSYQVFAKGDSWYLVVEKSEKD